MKQFLVLENLVKSYHGSTYCLGPLSLSLQTGEILALLGKNGAGKSTLFQLITGNLDPTSGSIGFGEETLRPDRFDLKRRMGYLPQHLELPRWVTGREILSYAISLYNLPDPKQTLERTLAYWDCMEFQHKPLAACSHGMQKRVALALATVHEPELLILDEPFSGLDLFHIKALTDILETRRHTGRTSILSTHVSHYAATLCHRALVLENGQASYLPLWESADTLQRITQIERHFFPSSPLREGQP